jgi:hypothetical protein
MLKRFSPFAVIALSVLLLVAAAFAISAVVAEAAPNSTGGDDKCYGDCPSFTFEASREVCPSGWFPINHGEHKGECGRFIQEFPFIEFTSKVTETFGPIDFTYDKSNDPKKCHRPTASSLGIPSWARDDYNGQFKEWLNAPEVECYETCDETIEQEPIVEYGPWSDWTWDGANNRFERSRTVTTTINHVDAKDGETICDRDVSEETEHQYRDPDQVIVGVELSCGPESEGGNVYQSYAKITVEPSGGATLTFDGQDFTETTVVYAGFKTYNWSAVAADGFNIVGDDSGSVKINRSECNDPPPPQDNSGGGDSPLVVWLTILGAALVGAGIAFRRSRRTA